MNCDVTFFLDNIQFFTRTFTLNDIVAQSVGFIRKIAFIFIVAVKIYFLKSSVRNNTKINMRLNV